MNTSGLNKKLIEGWQTAADDLGIRVTAPAELWDADGAKFHCEALIHDFGSPTGALVVSHKTERRIRKSLRSLGSSVWVSIVPDQQRSAYVRKHYIDELLDWGWFGELQHRPDWLAEGD